MNNQNLIAFAAAHYAAIGDGSARAVNLHADVGRSKKFISLIIVHSRPNAPSPETSFYAINAEVLAIDALPWFMRRDIQHRIQFAYEQSDGPEGGMIGSMAMVLLALDSTAFHILSAAFSRDVLVPPGNWKEDLLLALNSDPVPAA